MLGYRGYGVTPCAVYVSFFLGLLRGSFVGVVSLSGEALLFPTLVFCDLME